MSRESQTLEGASGSRACICPPAPMRSARRRIRAERDLDRLRRRGGQMVLDESTTGVVLDDSHPEAYKTTSRSVWR